MTKEELIGRKFICNRRDIVCTISEHVDDNHISVVVASVDIGCRKGITVKDINEILKQMDEL